MIKMNIATPIIAKTLAATGFAASVLLAAAPAHALDFNFRFQDVYGSNGINGTNGFIEGILTGLVEGWTRDYSNRYI